MTEFVKVWKSPEDLPRVIRRGLCDLSSRRIRWGLCVLMFKYLAAPTRRTTETAVGIGLPNHCLHQAYWCYFLNSFISSLLCWVIVHICVWRLWLKTFSISSVLFLQSVCLHLDILCLRFLYSVFVFISSWWACVYSVMLTSEYLFRCK